MLNETYKMCIYIYNIKIIYKYIQYWFDYFMYTKNKGGTAGYALKFKSDTSKYTQWFILRIL